MTARLLAAVVAVLAVAPACGRPCPASGCHPQVTVEVTASPRPDSAAATACLGAAAREGVAVSPAADGVTLAIRGGSFDAAAERDAVACLRRLPGVTDVRVLRPY